MIASHEFSEIEDEKDKTFIFAYYSFIEKLLSYHLQNKNNVNFKNTSENKLKKHSKHSVSVVFW